MDDADKKLNKWRGNKKYHCESECIINKMAFGSLNSNVSDMNENVKNDY